MHPVDRKYLISHSFTVSHIVFINKFYGSHAVTLIDALNVTTQAIELQIKHTNNSMGVFSVLSSTVPEQIQVLIQELDGKVKTYIMKVNKH